MFFQVVLFQHRCNRETFHDLNGSAFLGNNHDQGIRGFSQAHCGTVTCSIIGWQLLTVRQGQNDSHFMNPISFDDDGSIVNRIVFPENTGDHFLGNGAIP